MPGDKANLAVDRYVMNKCYRRKTNLSFCIGWIDFKKAFDMVSHSWISKTLEMFRVADNIINMTKGIG